MNGLSGVVFAPDMELTRGMMVQILYNLEGRLETAASAGTGENAGTAGSGYTESFTDVHTGDWFAKAVAWANGCGIIRGMTPDTLVPQGTATRAQIAQMMMAYLKNDEAE